MQANFMAFPPLEAQEGSARFTNRSDRSDPSSALIAILSSGRAA
jgi:hypothetical protein